MRNVVILGSTGSVGKAALEVLEAFPGRFRVTGLMARSSVDELVAQARRHRPLRVAVSDEACLPRLREALDGGAKALGPSGALDEMICAPGTDIVLDAIVGVAGLAPALAALEAGKDLAVANKEPLVAAGPLLMAAARESGANILPVDSEHSAIFQAMMAGRPEEVRQVLLTASGGPFRTRDPGTFSEIRPEEALRHPTWKMGPKITIDSATMMNKALEVLEAACLFGLPADRIRVLVHPQSVVHSMVEFRDGSIVAQMGRPDMKLPILFALSYPERLSFPGVRFSLEDFRSLTFEDPDPERYPALELGYRAARSGGLAGTVLNAANERAVEAFLAGQIRFDRIAPLAAQALENHEPSGALDLEAVLHADLWARHEVERCLT